MERIWLEEDRGKNLEEKAIMSGGMERERTISEKTDLRKAACAVGESS